MNTTTSYAAARAVYLVLLLAIALAVGLGIGHLIVEHGAADARPHLEGRADQIDNAVRGALA